jgi:heme exporter protein D
MESIIMILSFIRNIFILLIGIIAFKGIIRRATEGRADFGEDVAKIAFLGTGIAVTFAIKNMLPEIIENTSATESAALNFGAIADFFREYAWVFVAILLIAATIAAIIAVAIHRQIIAERKELKQRESDEAVLFEKLATLTENLEVIYKIQDSKTIPAAIKSQVKELETVAIAVKNAIKEQPRLVCEMLQFLSYHVPTTTTLLAEYHKVRSTPNALQSVPNAQTILSGIENHMETSIRIYKDVYNEMLQSRVYIVQSEISVSETMASQTR